jgi:hypothetical protein
MSEPQNSHVNLDPVTQDGNVTEMKGEYCGGIDDHRVVKLLDTSHAL